MQRAAGLVFHPKMRDNGDPVVIHNPTTPSAAWAWNNPAEIAVFVPRGQAPGALNGISVNSVDAPKTPTQWAEVAGYVSVADPELNVGLDEIVSAGAVIIESDQRVWLFEPTNHYRGYRCTFPKGRVEKDFSMRAGAAKEIFEETGLLVRIKELLIDVKRTHTMTRYFLAERIGGTPSDMGWGSTGGTSGAQAPSSRSGTVAPR